MCATDLGYTNIKERNLHAHVNKMDVQHTVLHFTQYTTMYIMI